MNTISNSPASDEQLLLAARLYYLDGLGQAEVARLVNVSQPKVSRLLALARQKGIVRITVADYTPRHEVLEQQLTSRLGLKLAVVIKTLPSLPAEVLRQTVGHFAAPAISALLAPNSVLAIAGGRTVREMVQYLETKSSGLTILQAMGNITSNISPVDAVEIGQTIARRFGGSFLMLNTPAFVPDKRTRDAFLSLGQIQSVEQRYGSVDLAIVGIGTMENSVFVDKGALVREDLDSLKRGGALGEICGRFYDAEGNECNTSFRDRVISIGFDQLRRIPKVVAVVSGNDRTAAIRAALRGGLINSLVVDQSGAEALLEASPEPAAKPDKKAKTA